MTHVLIRKLENGARLDADDREAIEQSILDLREVDARHDLIREGDRPEVVHVVVEGFACRYKTLEDGGRQIMAWLVPGDFCDLHVALLGHMDHSVSTLTRSRVAQISRASVETLIQRRNVNLALWWANLVDQAVLREWLVNMGRRSADHRIAHLFCELCARLEAVGLADDDTLELPITQLDLGDSLGLSSVHVNRVLQQLRDAGLIQWRTGHLKLLDPAKLSARAGFDPNYLHLGERRQRAAGKSLQDRTKS